MLNEMSPSVFDNSYLPGKEIAEDDFMLCYKDNQILLKKSGEEYEIPKKKDLKGKIGSPVYLFSINSQHCFGWNATEAEPQWGEFCDTLVLRNLRSKESAWIGAVGHQLMSWYGNNRFCGKCGSKTELKTDERATVCPHCKLTVYPKISPAVIVAITCKDRILLARGKHYKGDFYSLIAGYVDVGESIEETVAREVKEEIGLDIRNLKYYSSQPWPFSGSLMLAFTAEADDQQAIVIDEEEIHEAAWFTRGNLPKHAASLSIAGSLIAAFEKGLF